MVRVCVPAGTESAKLRESGLTIPAMAKVASGFTPTRRKPFRVAKTGADTGAEGAGAGVRETLGAAAVRDAGGRDAGGGDGRLAGSRDAADAGATPAGAAGGGAGGGGSAALGA